MSLERTEQEHLVLLEIGRDESVTLLIQFCMLPTLQVTKRFLPTSQLDQLTSQNMWTWIRTLRGEKGGARKKAGEREELQAI